MTATEVKVQLQTLADPERALVVARFFQTGPGQYAEGDQFLGMSMPQQRAVVRQFGALPMDETEKLVQDVYHECRMVGLLIWVGQSRKSGPIGRQAIMERYLANVQHVNNWDLVDCTCPAIVGEALLTEDRSILYELAATDHLWSQRIAMVSTLAFIRKNQLADTFALAEQLASHRHDLIHKAVGWMLREAGKRAPEALKEFLHDHIRQLPRTSLRYAIERFDPAKRQYYLMLR
jgi:3-methyladenine DNA glycosylase AlkD